MFEEFLNLIIETWESGIRGVGLNDLLACLAIVIGSLIVRTLLNTIVIDRIAKLASSTKNEFDDEIVKSLRTPFGLIPLAFGFYLIIRSYSNQSSKDGCYIYNFWSSCQCNQATIFSFRR